jgi:hypothetical protein
MVGASDLNGMRFKPHQHQEQVYWAWDSYQVSASKHAVHRESIFLLFSCKRNHAKGCWGEVGAMQRWSRGLVEVRDGVKRGLVVGREVRMRSWRLPHPHHCCFSRCKFPCEQTSLLKLVEISPIWPLPHNQLPLQYLRLVTFNLSLEQS